MKSIVITGLTGRVVEIGFRTVAAGEVLKPAQREARYRVKAAIRSAGFTAFDVGARMVDLPELGAAHDLAAAARAIFDKPHNVAFWGELALDGRVRPVPGAYVAAEACAAAGVPELFCSLEQAREASAAVGDKVAIFAVATFKEAVDILTTGEYSAPAWLDNPDWMPGGHRGWTDDGISLAAVKGCDEAKRAIERAVKTGENVLLVGPPGCGKTLLARTVTRLMAPMSDEERAEVARVASVAGMIGPFALPPSVRPFRAPHSTASETAMLGGGSPIRPGEIALAHNGVLFMDELPEWKMVATEYALNAVAHGYSLCSARGSEHVRFPSKPLVVAAMNPCPCGYLGSRSHACKCSESSLAAWNRRVDRLRKHFPIQVTMTEPTREQLTATA